MANLEIRLDNFGAKVLIINKHKMRNGGAESARVREGFHRHVREGRIRRRRCDKLITRDFGTGTRGFAASENPNVAVCVLPGTELAFAHEVERLPTRLWPWHDGAIRHKTAIFRQINKDVTLLGRGGQAAATQSSRSCLLVTFRILALIQFF